ncbi:MAG: TetR/AcrR family transcriptional regulator [bacterium]|nr:TetR/AcrR family transcriptional regulator [bacterium]
MTKGELTRQTILQQAAQVFSVRGYFGTSMDDLMKATDLTKGGIYNHFGSKEALALEAFEYAFGLVKARFRELSEGKRTTRDRLYAVLELFRSVLDDPLLAGGCPLLNTAVEADDANEPLRNRAREAADDWRGYISRTVRKGLELGDVRPEVEPEAVASVMISTLEGAIMLSKLYGDNIHMHRTVDHMAAYIDSLLK